MAAVQSLQGQTCRGENQNNYCHDWKVGVDKRSAVPPLVLRPIFGGTALPLSHPTFCPVRQDGRKERLIGLIAFRRGA
jgi:hypothetical protein